MTVTAQLGTTGQQVAAGAVQTGGAIATAVGVAQGASWVPIVGPIVAGVTLALGLLFARKGPRQKVAATKIVEQLEPLLKQNLEGYLSGPHTRSSQAQALRNFDEAWAWLTSTEACGNPELGNPGKACIADRQPGGKHDWFALYRDPIAKDPNVRDDATAQVLAETIARPFGLDPTAAVGVAAIALGVLL